MKSKKDKPTNEIIAKIKRIKIIKYTIFALCVLVLSLSLIWHNDLTKMINPNYYKNSEYIFLDGKQDLQNSNLKVHFIDVGCADCTFIELPDNKNMLIDCAGDILDKDKSKESMQLYLNNNVFSNREKVIDYLVLTHTDIDHIYGANDILKTYRVNNIIRPKILSKDEINIIKDKNEYAFAKNYKVDYSDEYNKQILGIYNYIQSNSHAKMYFASANLDFSTPEYKLKLLTPNNDVYEQDNDYSCAVRLEYKQKAFMFMADCTSVGEDEILNNYFGDIEQLKTDFVKIGHHGSNTSSNAAFLNSLNANYYIVSTRVGVYSNVPSNEVFKRIQDSNSNAKILRTDVNGNMLISLNNNGDYNISTSQGSFYFIRHNVFLQWYYLAICIGVMCFILIFSIKLKSYEQRVQAKRNMIIKQKQKMLEEARRLNNNV